MAAKKAGKATDAAAPEAKKVNGGATRSSRAAWKGAVQFGPLVQFPVEMVKGDREVEKLSFNNHHGEACSKGNGKIGGKVKREPVTITKENEGFVGHSGFCETCGESVKAEEIVKGFEGHYVDTALLEDLPVKSDKVIVLDRIVKATEIDPMFLDSPYWLVPGKGGDQAYTLLLRLLNHENVAIGKVAISTRGKREQLVAIRTVDGALLIQTMRWASQVVSAPLDLSAQAKALDPKLVAMGEMLMGTLAGPFEPEKYTDEYAAAVQGIVGRIMAGEDVAPTTDAEQTAESAPFDLLAALKESVEKAKVAA